MPVGVDPVSVVVTDLNLDGFADIATANEDGQSFSVLFNNGDGTFADAVNFDVAGRPIQIFAETINDDQLPDIGIFDKDTDSVIIFANMGDGTFQRAATVLVGDGATSFVLGDFNADGAQDIAVVYDYGLLTIYHPDQDPFQDPGSGPAGTGGVPDGATLREFMAFEDYQIGGHLENMVAADFTGDGIADFAMSDPLAGVVHFLGSTDAVGGYEAPMTFEVGPDPSWLTAGDIDQDGDIDMLVTSEDYNTLAVIANNGSGPDAPVFYDVGSAPSFAFVTDLDGDGSDDVFVANKGDGTITVFSRDVNSQFGRVADLVAGDGLAHVVAADLNNDGQLELVTANSDSNSITIMSFAFDPNSPDIEVLAPRTPDLLAASDTGVSDTDNETALDNGPASTLSFQVDGVAPGAIVKLWVDGYVVGSATAGNADTSVTIVSDGLHVLTEGDHVFFATQIVGGVMSLPSGFLIVDVDLPEVEDDSGYDIIENDAGEVVVVIESVDGSAPLEVNLTQIVDAPTIIGAIVAANEPKAEDETYAAGQTDAGFVLFSGGSTGEWEARNLTTEITGAEPITSNVMKSYTTPWGLVNFVGFNDQGDLLVYWQNGETNGTGEQEWIFHNLYDTQIRADGQETPNFNGDISVYVTDWGGLNITGVDQNGDLQVVWWSPEEGWWRATNLTAELGGESLVGHVDTDVELPDTIRLFGTTETGALVMYEWNPTDQWVVTEITALTGDGDLAIGSVSGFADSTGRITAAAIADTGTEAVIFWLNSGGSWEVNRIAVDAGDLLIGQLQAFENADGTLSVHGKTIDDSPFEVAFDAGSNVWNRIV